MTAPRPRRPWSDRRSGRPRVLPGDTPPRSLATGAAWRLLDEAVLGERAEVERGVGRRLAERLAGLGGRHRPVPAEQLEQGDADRVGQRAHLPGVGELAPLRVVGQCRSTTAPDPGPTWRWTRGAHAAAAAAATLGRRRGRARRRAAGRAAAVISGCMVMAPSQQGCFEVYVSKELVVKCRCRTIVAVLPLIDVAPLLDPDGDHRHVAAEIDARLPRRSASSASPATASPDGRPRRARPPRPARSSRQPDDVKARDRHGPRRRGVAGLVPARRRADVRAAGPQGRHLLRRRAAADDPRSRRPPLHGANLFPAEPAGLRDGRARLDRRA